METLSKVREPRPGRKGMLTHEPHNHVKARAKANALTAETRVCSRCSSIASKGCLAKKLHAMHSDISSPNNLSQLQFCNKHGKSGIFLLYSSQSEVQGKNE
ncbi:hypothetical protein Fot_22009 [Forsythia ovata]|uniref:50S ribosomal protein L28, chloroplastic n=1 Tax=Forsythia ovata TaxID=205694 RepID=A0ABD1UWI0_9LAMI